MPHDPISDANTPLTPEEQADLIPSLATREELNEWERDNILRGRQWALSERQISRLDPAKETYIRKLHARMFDQTWKWAGTYGKRRRISASHWVKFVNGSRNFSAMPRIG